MVSVIGKSPSEIFADLENQFGHFEMVEDNLSFAPELKETIHKTLITDKKLPEFSEKVEWVNYIDGCKVYFENGDFVICRFSGTEPLLRIFAESGSAQKAQEYIDAMKAFLAI